MQVTPAKAPKQSMGRTAGRHRMSAVLVVLLSGVAALAQAQASNGSALQVLRSQAMPGTEPLLADAPGGAVASSTVAAIVQLTAESSALMVAREVRPGSFEIVARTKRFAAFGESNYGAAIELFRFNAPDRLELSISARSGCSRRLATHRFALRQGTWQVTGLDASAMRCTENGVEEDWRQSSNYISGKTVRTTFTSAGRAKHVQSASPRKAFALLEFPPDGPEVEYSEMR